MAMIKTKFKISIKELSFEFEGSQELGRQIQQGLQQSIGTLMNTQARALSMRDGPSMVEAAPVEDPVLDGQNGQTVQQADGTKTKTLKPRKPRGGPSLVTLLRTMKEEGFFKQTRSGGEATARLKDKGHTFRPNTVLTELQRLVQKEELYRDKNGDGVYLYKDSPFNEGSRSPSQPDQPLQ